MTLTQYKKTRRATGGPSRSLDPAPEGRPEGPDTDAGLVALEGLTTADLRIEWRRLHRATPPSRLSRDLLIRGVAYRIQEQAHGGLSPGTRRMLRSLSEGSERRGRATAVPAIRLKPGTKLVQPPTEYDLTLRQADQARTDFVVIEDGLEFIMAQLAKVPTRKELAWIAAGSFVGRAALAGLLALVLLGR